MSSPIRVAYALTPITFGGAEKVSLNFLSNVDPTKVDLHLIALVRPWEEPPMLLDEVERLGISCSTVPVAIKPGGDFLRIFRVVWALYRIFRQRDFDLLHTHGYFADICAIPIAKIFRIPSLSTCHGFIDTDRKLRLYNRLDLLALKLCDRVIAVSDGIRDRLVDLGIAKEKVEVIANAVPVPSFASEQANDALSFRQEHGFSQKDLIFVYVGRLSEEKGLRFLLEAFVRLVQSNTCVRLVLIGEGPQRKMLEQQAVDLGVEELVLLAGFQEQVSPWLAIADCFVLPSLTEGTPMALLEAMAAGVPILATRVGGVPDVIADGFNGLLVPCKDADALWEAMSRMVENPGLRDKYRREARNTVKAGYSVEPWSQKILHTYHEICSPGASCL